MVNNCYSMEDSEGSVVNNSYSMEDSEVPIVNNCYSMDDCPLRILGIFALGRFYFFFSRILNSGRVWIQYTRAYT